MSWDNVKGVSSAQIWTDNPDMTQAYLFANGNHQVKLTVGLSLTLSDATQPGPTEDEVKAALSLVDYETGAGVRFIKTGAKGGYDYVYQPNMPATINVLSASDTSNPGAYQYELDYYVSSDSTINANYASEKVALFLSYINSSGAEVDYNTASGSKSQSYVAVTVYPPKKYGTAGSSSTPVIIALKDDKPNYTNEQTANESNEKVSIYQLRIDDGYFRIISFQANNTVQSPNPFTRRATNNSSGGAGHYPVWVTYEAFLPVQNKINQGAASYDSKLTITYNNNNYAYFSLTVTVNQEQNEIIFIHFYSEINDTSEVGFVNNTSTASLFALDQFGNELNVIVSEDNDGIKIDSVT